MPAPISQDRRRRSALEELRLREFLGRVVKLQRNCLLAYTCFAARHSWRMVWAGTSTAAMTSIIRIRKRGHRNLFSDVESGAGDRTLIGASFSTIGRFESGLAVLFQAAQSPGSVAVEPDADTTGLDTTKRDMRVRFVGHFDADGIRKLLAGALIAIVVDERPADQRRADLSGRLRDLEH